MLSGHVFMYNCAIVQTLGKVGGTIVVVSRTDI